MSDFIEKTLGAWMDEMAQRYHDHEARYMLTGVSG